VTSRLVAVAVVVHDGRVLVGRRPDDAAEAPGRAEFPGGKVESHETTMAAAARECLEEAGIAVRVLGRAVHVAVNGATQPSAIAFHWAEPIDPAVRPRSPFSWVPIVELPRFPFPAPNAAVVALLRSDVEARHHGGS